MTDEFNRASSNLDAFDFLELPEMNQQEQKWSNNKQEFNFVFAYDDNVHQYEFSTETKELDSKAKTYIQTGIKSINSYCRTKISAPFYTIIALVIASIAILFFSFYISLFIITFCFWNPVIFLIILLVFVRYAFAVVVFLFSSINYKYLSYGIKRLINNLNTVDKLPNVTWSYGRDGSWIEVRVVNKK